jgi:hypothetical protein
MLPVAEPKSKKFAISDNEFGWSHANALYSNQQRTRWLQIAIIAQLIQLFHKLGRTKMSVTVTDLYQKQKNIRTLV